MAGYMMSSIKRPAVSATKASGDQSSMPLEDALAILLQGKPAYHSLEIHHKVSEVVMSILEVNKTMMLWNITFSCMAIFLPNCGKYRCNFFYKEQPITLNFRLRLPVTYCSNQLETNASNSSAA